MATKASVAGTDSAKARSGMPGLSPKSAAKARRSRAPLGSRCGARLDHRGRASYLPDMTPQLDFFSGADAPALPPGFRYEPLLLAVDEQDAMLAALRPLPFKEFEFHGFLGKRRVVSFGWKYDF